MLLVVRVHTLEPLQAGHLEDLEDNGDPDLREAFGLPFDLLARELLPELQATFRASAFSATRPATRQ